MAFLQKIKEFFAIISAALLVGLCAGILGGLMFMFVRTHPLIALGLTAICLLFRLSALKKNWRNKNYLVFVSYIFVTFVCICAPASLVWIGIITSRSDFNTDSIDKLVFLLLILFITVGFAFVTFTLKYFGETRFGKTIAQTLEGAEIITGLRDF